MESIDSILGGMGYDGECRPVIGRFRIPRGREMLRRGLAKCGHLEGEPTWVQGYDDIVEWLGDNRRTGLLLMGDNGLGKSLICMHVIPTLYRFYFGRAFTCVSAVDVNRDIDAMRRRCFLSIDDVGTEHEHVSFGERRHAIPEIVDAAELLGHELLLSTNMDMRELACKYGVRTADRLRAICRVVVVRGESLRRRG